MTRGRDEILAERLKTVLALGEANAAQNKAVASAGGAEITRLAAENGTWHDHESDAQDEAHRRLADADTRVADLEARLAALDAELAAIDH